MDDLGGDREQKTVRGWRHLAPRHKRDVKECIILELSWCVWEILDKYPALVRHYSEGAAGAAGAAAFLRHYYFLRTLLTVHS